MASRSKQQGGKQKTRSSGEPLWKPHVPPGTLGPEEEDNYLMVMCVPGSRMSSYCLSSHQRSLVLLCFFDITIYSNSTLISTQGPVMLFKGWTILCSKKITIQWICIGKINYTILWIVIIQWIPLSNLWATGARYINENRWTKWLGITLRWNTCRNLFSAFWVTD